MKNFIRAMYDNNAVLGFVKVKTFYILIFILITATFISAPAILFNYNLTSTEMISTYPKLKSNVIEMYEQDLPCTIKDDNLVCTTKENQQLTDYKLILDGTEGSGNYISLTEEYLVIYSVEGKERSTLKLYYKDHPLDFSNENAETKAGVLLDKALEETKPIYYKNIFFSNIMTYSIYTMIMGLLLLMVNRERKGKVINLKQSIRIASVLTILPGIAAMIVGFLGISYYPTIFAATYAIRMFLVYGYLLKLEFHPKG